jgi:putative tryptophan/tyrosine transport system substrate-binding protein
VKRREFITLLGGAAAAWPLAARAQLPIGRTGKMPRLGMLMPGPAAHSAATLDSFYRGLHELGYIEGQNLAIERRERSAHKEITEFPRHVREKTSLPGRWRW